MKQKIELYREVMELEPGSRVFFPLAKMLLQDERPDEAIDVLRNGLLRRPDHVEARLLLVELLSRKGDVSDLDVEMGRLEQLFASYPAFWEEWSERLARRPESKDAAVAGRFFSLSMQGKAVSWADVIDEGLRAFAGASPRPRAMEMPELSLNVETSAPRPVEPVFTMPDLSLSPAQPAVAEPFPADDEFAPKVMKVAAVSASQAEAEHWARLEPKVPVDDADLPSVSVSVAVAQPVETEEHAALADMEADEDLDPVDLQGLEFSGDDAEEAPIFRHLENVGSDEDFTLRTRSMAEILAEQGDYAGALEIYRELEAGAAPAEKIELTGRIVELETRLNESAVEIQGLEGYEMPGSDGTKLVDLLESLAKRLEARAR